MKTNAAAPLPNDRIVKNLTRDAKHYLADLVAGEVQPTICPELIELRWRGLVDTKGQPNALARAQPWL